MPFLLVMILCCKLIYYCLVRGAPIAEDVPHDPIVALHGEEAKGAVVGLYLPALGEPAHGQNVTVRGSHVLLVRAVLSNAGDEGLYRSDLFIVLVTVITSIEWSTQHRAGCVSRGEVWLRATPPCDPPGLLGVFEQSLYRGLREICADTYGPVRAHRPTRARDRAPHSARGLDSHYQELLGSYQ